MINCFTLFLNASRPSLLPSSDAPLFARLSPHHSHNSSPSSIRTRDPEKWLRGT